MANTGKRGFASMDIEKQRFIASKGGRAAHAKGKAHEWSTEEARAAGRKGGESRGNRSLPSDALADRSYATTSAGQTGIGMLANSGMIGAHSTTPNGLNSGGLASTFLAEAGSSLRGTPQPLANA